jgi:hypothetical protein
MGGIKIPSDGKNEKTFQEKFIGFFKHEPIYYWIHYKIEIGFLLAIFLMIL